VTAIDSYTFTKPWRRKEACTRVVDVTAVARIITILYTVDRKRKRKFALGVRALFLFFFWISVCVCV
jgi:DNA polymerase III delta subunit